MQTRPGGDEALMVPLPSGDAVQPTMTEVEATYLTERVRRYQRDNALSNTSHLATLDNILVSELLCYRWGTWLGQGTDYQGGRIDIGVLTRDLERYNMRIAAMKKSLGLDKPTMDRQKGEGSVADYLTKLPLRAKAFGIMRNQQSARATDLLMELIGLVTVYRNCGDDEERKELRVMPQEILDWVWDIARPEIEEIDRKFRQDGPDAQRTWIRVQ